MKPGSAVLFDWPADDGWPDDAGLWPWRIGGRTLRPVQFSGEGVQGVRRLFISKFIKFLLRSR
jgi:hypothetical protein